MRREFELTAKDGKKLFARVHTADTPRANIVLIHGLGEHGDRYKRLAEVMNEKGFSVYAHDLRGHGRTQGRQGVARLSQLAQDAVSMVEWAHAQNGKPVFLYGHSLGGLIGLYAVLREKPGIVGAIITSPWLVLVKPPPKMLFALAGAFAPVLSPFAVPNGISGGQLSHDPLIKAEYETDTYNHGKIGLALAGDAGKGAKWVLAHAKELSVPLLLCHGAEDPICSVAGSRAFAKDNALVTCKEFAGMYHELHNEPDACNALYETELAFIEETLSLAAQGVSHAGIRI